MNSGTVLGAFQWNCSLFWAPGSDASWKRHHCWVMQICLPHFSTTKHVWFCSITLKGKQTHLQTISPKVYKLTPKQFRWINSTTGQRQKIYTIDLGVKCPWTLWGLNVTCSIRLRFFVFIFYCFEVIKSLRTLYYTGGTQLNTTTTF